jgi:hypothetical protein
MDIGPNSYDNEGMNHSDHYFYEVADAVIYSPRAPIDHHVGAVTDYLPQYCYAPYERQFPPARGCQEPVTLKQYDNVRKSFALSGLTASSRIRKEQPMSDEKPMGLVDPDRRGSHP